MGQFAVKQQIHSELRKLLPPRLPEFLTKQRWFGGKARQIRSVEIADIIPLQRDGLEALLLVIAVSYAAGSSENYALPVIWRETTMSAFPSESELVSIRNEEAGTVAAVMDASRNTNFLGLLLATIQNEDGFRGEHGELRGIRAGEFWTLDRLPSKWKPKLLSGEQSNTSLVFDDEVILKFFRRMEEGINPELEIGAFLTQKAHFPHVPQLAGHLEYRDQRGSVVTQGILQTFVPNQGDAWRHILRSLAGFYEQVTRHEDEAPRRTRLGPPAKAGEKAPEFVRAAVETDLAAVALLGQRTAELHHALASEMNDPAFAPEPFTMEFQKEFLASVLKLTSGTLRLLHEKRGQLPPQWQAQADTLARRETQIAEVLQAILSEPIRAVRTRIHGDYHLGQVLYTGSDFVIIDFEGEPARSLSERRVKRSPLQDVAGMMRSFHYAAFAPLFGAVGKQALEEDELKELTPWAEAWSKWFTKSFVDEYFRTSADAIYLPSSTDATNNLLKAHLLEKAIYELSYELNNRPTWVGIPLQGISALLHR